MDGKVIFVREWNETGPWDGKTQATGFRSIRDALVIVKCDDQVWLLEPETNDGGAEELE